MTTGTIIAALIMMYFCRSKTFVAFMFGVIMVFLFVVLSIFWRACAPGNAWIFWMGIGSGIGYWLYLQLVLKATTVILGGEEEDF